MAAGLAWKVRQGLKTGVVWSRFHGEVDRDSQPGRFKIDLITNGLFAAIWAILAVVFSLMPVPH